MGIVDSKLTDYKSGDWRYCTSLNYQTQIPTAYNYITLSEPSAYHQGLSFLDTGTHGMESWQSFPFLF